MPTGSGKTLVGFQFTLISTRGLRWNCSRKNRLSVLPYFDFYGITLKNFEMRFQFFLISTPPKHCIVHVVYLSVLPYFDTKVIQMNCYEISFSSSLFRPLINAYLSKLGFFQFFHISTPSQFYLPVQSVLSVLPYFDKRNSFGFLNFFFFQFFLISTSSAISPTKQHQLSVLPYFDARWWTIVLRTRWLSVLPYFDTCARCRHVKKDSFSSSLFRRHVTKTKKRISYFQFFLISTPQQVHILLSALIFQFFLISTNYCFWVSPAYTLSVLPYFDSVIRKVT